jgi:hypothetical protein
LSYGASQTVQYTVSLKSASKLTLIYWWMVNIIIGIAIKISDITTSANQDVAL